MCTITTAVCMSISEKKDEIKKFEEGRREHIDAYGYAELKDYQPEYANMYKCTKHGTWLYAAARFEFIG